MNHKKEEMMTAAEFESSLEEVGNIFENRKGVEIEYLENVCLLKDIWTAGPTLFSLYLELPVDRFIAELNLKNWADVDAIDETMLWNQYRKGNAYVWADLSYFCETELSFSINNGSTVISSEQLSYKDELAEVLDNITVVRSYVRAHIHELYMAVEALED